MKTPCLFRRAHRMSVLPCPMPGMAIAARGMFVLLLATCCGWPSSAVADVVLHVATTGNDAAAGNATAPLATPHAALERAVGIAEKTADAEVRIVLHAGTYRIAAPLAISLRHVPPQGSLTLIAAERERVVISGGQTINNWQVETDGTWSATVPEELRRSGGFRELFVNGQRRARARHPNTAYLRIAQAFSDKRSGFTFNEGDLPNSWSAGGELVFLHDWSTSRIPVKSVDHVSRQLTAALAIGSAGDHFKIDHFEPHPRYFVENRAEFFDAPGEWLLDQEQGVLRYKPLPNELPQTSEVVAPLAVGLLNVAGDEGTPIRNVHFRGLQFEHCAWQLPSEGYVGIQATAHDCRDDSGPHSRAFIPAAIEFAFAEDCSFTAGRIAHVGTSGIEFGRRTHRCHLEDSVIEDIAGNGINLGESATLPVDQTASQLVVSHNRIERCGQQFYGAVAVWGGIVREVRIEHNEIAHHPYTGVSLGWMWNPTPTSAANNRVARNHIHHVMQILSDGGGIYTLGRQPGTQLVENVIHDVPLNAGSAESNGMFLDEGSDEMTIADNVIYNTVRSPLRFHKAFQMIVRHNTLVLPNDETPPLRFNSTSADTIDQIDNRIVLRANFDPNTVELPAVGPR